MGDSIPLTYVMYAGKHNAEPRQVNVLNSLTYEMVIRRYTVLGIY